ncbi:hypothetical protein O6H91_Y362500 [Diphasiastrum complanatum]|nr:hypothetical protein O6H91_Y362500 [Diphasiastrum complanatum]
MQCFLLIENRRKPYHANLGFNMQVTCNVLQCHARSHSTMQGSYNDIQRAYNNMQLKISIDNEKRRHSRRGEMGAPPPPSFGIFIQETTVQVIDNSSCPILSYIGTESYHGSRTPAWQLTPDFSLPWRHTMISLPKSSLQFGRPSLIWPSPCL